LLLLGGCASMVTGNLGQNLSLAIMNQDDPETVQAGAPAYLILIDSLIAGNPDDRANLLAGSRLYSAYAGIFVSDRERSQRLANRALDYSGRAICPRHTELCAHSQGPYQDFLPWLKKVGKRDIDALYTHALAWALWTQSHSDDWNAIANLPKIEAMFVQVITLQPDYQQGDPWLYLGILRTLLPPAMGGRPEAGREAFEQAIHLSDGQNLMAKVEYARRYARLVFEQPLHDRLLQEVMAADPHVAGHTLSNVLAQREAKRLLAESPDYF
jgi:hypothetical protein